MIVGEYIKQLRIASGLTQEELGKLLGVKRAAVNKWESGMVQNLKRTTIQKLADIFQVNPVSFINGSSPIDCNINDLCTQNGVTKSHVLKTLNITVSNNEQYSDDNIEKLSDYFHVSRDFLYNQPDMAICPCCNVSFGINDNSKQEAHIAMHNKYLSAVKEFGFCWGPAYRAEVKGYAEEIIKKESSTVQEVHDACVLKIKVLFSRSLANCHYSTKHIDFSEYFAALLGQKEPSDRIPEKVFDSLVAEYGTNNLIPNGTYYSVPKDEQSEDKIAFLTPQEETLLERFRNLNNQGQEDALKYLNLLQLNPEYKKPSESLMYIAAESTDNRPSEIRHLTDDELKRIKAAKPVTSDDDL